MHDTCLGLLGSSLWDFGDISTGSQVLAVLLLSSPIISKPRDPQVLSVPMVLSGAHIDLKAG